MKRRSTGTSIPPFRQVVDRLEPRLLFAVFYVDPNAPGPMHDGSSWENAFAELRSALVSGSTNEIRVADGTYVPGTRTVDTFTLRSNLTIRGAYAGYGAPDPDARDVFAHPSVLSGEIGQPGVTSDNVINVVTASGADTTAVLDGVTISGAARSGVYNIQGSPTLNNCTVSDNESNRGGGMYNSYAAPVLTDCTFLQNSAYAPVDEPYGGAMYNAYSTPTLLRCTFTQNRSYTYGGFSIGGAIYNLGSAPILDHCSFTGNSASQGGAIASERQEYFNSSPTLRDCTFLRNTAIYGAAISSEGSLSPTVLRCTFNGNVASESGGAVYERDFVHAQFLNCVFAGNMAKGFQQATGGAAVYSAFAYSTYRNCTFAANSDGTSTFLNSSQSSYTQPEITNCIVWSSGNSGIYSPVMTVTVSCSDVKGGYAGTGVINSDPLFTLSPTPGADNTWGTQDDNYGDLALQALSPAIDGGSDAAVPAGTTTDYAGQPRFVDAEGAGATGSTVDMGALEASPPLTASAGGPYTLVWGQSMPLSGRGVGVVPGPLQYAWEWSGDDQFDDAAGASPSFDSTLWPTAGTTVTVALRVTDGTNHFVVSTATMTVLPAVLYVDARATGSGNGTTWANAYTSFASALTAAISGQSIHVAGGVHKPTTTLNRNAAFTLKSGVPVIGGFAGIGAADPDLRDLSRYRTTLSGEIGSPTTNADNSIHVVTGSNVDSSAVLDGFLITAGNASGTFNFGGGLFVRDGNPTLLNCTFSGNVNTGAYFTAASPRTLINCQFIGNTAARGGGAYFSFGSTTLINCAFTDNAATISGGGIYANNTALSLTNCILTRNSATTSGPQLFLTGGTAGVSYSNVQGGGFAGAGNIDADAQFVRNPGPGVDNTWGTADDDYGDLRLQMTSPCVDVGNNAAVPADVTTDLAGDPRLFDFPGVHDPGGAIVDMGAYELGMRIGLVHVAAGQTLSLPPGGRTFVVEQLQVDPAGTLDLRDNSVILDYAGGPSPLSTIEQLVRSARAGGTWSGTGLTSSAARDNPPHTTTLGVIDRVDYAGASFNGVPLDADAVLIKYTYYGDANFDGRVTFDDYVRIDTGFNARLTGWANGDFNLDGAVNFDDYVLIDIAFNTQASTLRIGRNPMPRIR